MFLKKRKNLFLPFLDFSRRGGVNGIGWVLKVEGGVISSGALSLTVLFFFFFLLFLLASTSAAESARAAEEEVEAAGAEELEPLMAAAEDELEEVARGAWRVAAGGSASAAVCVKKNEMKF